MAGLGRRFVDEGYSVTKPLIPVSEKPMVTQSTHDLPAAVHHVFVLRSGMPEYQEISNEHKRLYPESRIETIPGATEGQACTALIGLEALEHAMGSATGPVTFGACDNGALYDDKAFHELIDNQDVDVIVWGTRGHANAVRHPKIFGGRWAAGVYSNR